MYRYATLLIKLYCNTAHLSSKTCKMKMLHTFSVSLRTKILHKDQLYNSQIILKNRNSEIHHHSIEEHPKVNVTAKFGFEML